MNPITLSIPISTPALQFAGSLLEQAGVRMVSQADEAEYLLYPCPTSLSTITDYSSSATIIGGNLDFLNPSVRRIDLLKDPFYLADNAAITAEAALGMVLSRLPCAISQGEILILGWGRIGKCLTHQLAHLNAPVTVYARKPKDQALLRALGYHPISTQDLPASLPQFRCIINSIPQRILPVQAAQAFRPDCFLLDLASAPGLPGDTVIHARGLPGKYKPESSGKLIAKTILYHTGGI